MFVSSFLINGPTLHNKCSKFVLGTCIKLWKEPRFHNLTDHPLLIRLLDVYHSLFVYSLNSVEFTVFFFFAQIFVAFVNAHTEFSTVDILAPIKWWNVENSYVGRVNAVCRVDNVMPRDMKPYQVARHCRSGKCCSMWIRFNVFDRSLGETSQV